VHHIPNAVDAEFAAALRPLRKMDDCNVLVVNRNFADEHKGFSLIREALLRVPAALRTKLLLVGENSAAAAAELTGWRCESRGYISSATELASIYSRAAIFLFASPAENFPCVVLEAMAAGACVVATPTGGVLEQIQDGVSGILAAEISGPALADALIRALNEPRAIRELGNNGRIRAESTYRESVFIERHEAVYTEAIQAFRAAA
jgi:glycosyltransferase involved in cell wall biosynthesis